MLSLAQIGLEVMPFMLQAGAHMLRRTALTCVGMMQV